MKTKIGVGRTAEVFDYDDEKVVKLFYENISDEEINLEYSNNKIIESLGHLEKLCFKEPYFSKNKKIIA